MPNTRLTPAMRTCLRLLTEGDLYSIDFNRWTLKGEGASPAPGRFVAAVVIRKALKQELVAFNGNDGVKMTDKGKALYQEFPEVRRGREMAAAAPRPRLGKTKVIGRKKGVTVYCFTHKDKPHAFTTEREVVRQVRSIQAQAWKKSPDDVPTIQVRSTRMHLLNDHNAAIVLRDGIDALIAEVGYTDYEPVIRKGFYRHYLEAQRKPTEKLQGERRASKRSVRRPTVDPVAPEAP